MSYYIYGVLGDIMSHKRVPLEGLVTGEIVDRMRFNVYRRTNNQDYLLLYSRRLPVLDEYENNLYFVGEWVEDR